MAGQAALGWGEVAAPPPPGDVTAARCGRAHGVHARTPLVAHRAPLPHACRFDTAGGPGVAFACSRGLYHHLAGPAATRRAWGLFLSSDAPATQSLGITQLLDRAWAAFADVPGGLVLAHEGSGRLLFCNGASSSSSGSGGSRVEEQSAVFQFGVHPGEEERVMLTLTMSRMKRTPNTPCPCQPPPASPRELLGGLAMRAAAGER